MKVGELFFQLGFDVKADSLKGFQRGLDETISSLGIFADVKAAAALYAIDRLVEGAIKGASSLHNFTEQTGLSNQELQKWQAASTLSNIALSADDVTQSVSALNKQLIAIQRYGGQGANVGAFRQLRLDPTILNTPFKALEAISHAIQGMNRGVATGLLEQLGINPGMINILEKGTDEVERLAKGIGLADGEVEKLNHAGGVIADFTTRLSNASKITVANIIPALDNIIVYLKQLGAEAEDVGKSINKFAQDFPEAAKAIAAGIGLIVVAMSPLIRSLLVLGGLVDVFKKVASPEMQQYFKNIGATGNFGQQFKDFSNFAVKAAGLKSLIPEDSNLLPQGNRGASSTANNATTTNTMNNNFTIHTVPDNITDKIMQDQWDLQRKFNGHALNDLSGGVVK